MVSTGDVTVGAPLDSVVTVVVRWVFNRDLAVEAGDV